MTVHSAGGIGPHLAVGILHFQEVSIAETHFFQDLLARNVVGCGVRNIAHQVEQLDSAEHGYIHPLAQIAGIVPASGDIHMLAIVAAARAVQVQAGCTPGTSTPQRW